MILQTEIHHAATQLPDRYGIGIGKGKTQEARVPGAEILARDGKNSCPFGQLFGNFR